MSSFSDLDLQCENCPGVPANGEEQRPPRGHGRGRSRKEHAGGSDQTFLGAPEKWKGKFEWLVAGLYVHRMRVIVSPAPITVYILLGCFYLLSFFISFFISLSFCDSKKKDKLHLQKL